MEFAELLKSYKVSVVHGDRWGGEWPREKLAQLGRIHYQISTLTKSEIYSGILPKINSQALELLDLPRLRNQLLGLERRTSRAGKDSIDHSPGPSSHDDVCNAACGALLRASRPVVEYDGTNAHSSGPLPPRKVF